MHVGVHHEQEVARRLEASGWDVQRWGQGQFTETIRQALVAKRPTVYWRWMPDLVAARGTRICLIDPKSDSSSTPNFSIEIDAYIAHRAMLGFGLPIVYVWADMTVNTVDGLYVVRWELRPQRGINRGSGTPFALVRKIDQQPFEKFFGPPLEASA